MEPLAVFGPHAAMAKQQRKNSTARRGEGGFQMGLLVQVPYGKIFETVECPPFRSQLYGPCRVNKATQSRYRVLSSTGMPTQKPIHARRLVPYHSRS